MTACEERREEISALLDGELPGPARAPLEAHLGQCRECEAALGELRATRDALAPVLAAWRDSAPAPHDVQEARPSQRRRRLVAAGLAVAAAALIVVAMLPRGDDAPRDARLVAAFAEDPIPYAFRARIDADGGGMLWVSGRRVLWTACGSPEFDGSEGAVGCEEGAWFEWEPRLAAWERSTLDGAAALAARPVTRALLAWIQGGGLDALLWSARRDPVSSPDAEFRAEAPADGAWLRGSAKVDPATRQLAALRVDLRTEMGDVPVWMWIEQGFAEWLGLEGWSRQGGHLLQELRGLGYVDELGYLK